MARTGRQPVASVVRTRAIRAGIVLVGSTEASFTVLPFHRGLSVVPRLNEVTSTFTWHDESFWRTGGTSQQIASAARSVQKGCTDAGASEALRRVHFPSIVVLKRRQRRGSKRERQKVKEIEKEQEKENKKQKKRRGRERKRKRRERTRIKRRERERERERGLASTCCTPLSVSNPLVRRIPVSLDVNGARVLAR